MFEVLHEVLQKRNFYVSEHCNDYLSAKGLKVRVRALAHSHSIQFAFNATFDRWANSVDYETALPEREDTIIALLDTVDTMKPCEVCQKWVLPTRLIQRRVFCERCYEKRSTSSKFHHSGGRR